MITQLTKKTEIKIYILYVMKHIGYPIEYDRLNDTLTSEGAVDYFGFSECFSELLETGNVKPAMGKTEECYQITDQGINVVDNLIDTLIPSVQRSALAAAVRLTSFDKRGAVTKYGYTPTDNGKFRFNFEICEYDISVFSVSVILETEEQAQQMEYNLSKKPDDIYKAVMALLSGRMDYLLNGTV